MIASIAALATRIGSKVGAWIEAAYVLDCTELDPEAGPEAESRRGTSGDWTWLPALSGVTVASAQAIQSHAMKAHHKA
jgi:hypothetical protein